MMSENDNATALLTPDSGTKVHKKRWWILLLFSMVAVMQDTIWNTWNPVDSAATIVYGWSDDLIELLSNYSYIFYIIAFLPVVSILNSSLRKAMCFSAFLMTLGTMWRALYMQDPNVNRRTFTVSCHICSILNSVANITIGSAPLAISALWFPSYQRVTATAIATVFTGTSYGMSFLISNIIVRPVDSILPNSTMPSPGDITPELLESLIQDLRYYMFSNAIPTGLLFVFIIAFFPSAPEVPPSNSSKQPRLSLVSSFMSVLLSKDAWLIVIGLAVSQGVLYAWTAKQVETLSHLCVGSSCLTRKWIRYLGVYTALVTTVSTVMVAQVADRTHVRVKRTIAGMLSLAFLVFLLLSLVSLHVITIGSFFLLKVIITFFIITGNSLMVSSMPLAMEMLMEICFPAAEAVVGGFISLCVNIITVVLLAFFHIPNIGSAWLHCMLPMSSLLFLFTLLPIKVVYNRKVIDTEDCEVEDTA